MIISQLSLLLTNFLNCETYTVIVIRGIEDELLLEVKEAPRFFFLTHLSKDPSLAWTLLWTWDLLWTFLQNDLSRIAQVCTQCTYSQALMFIFLFGRAVSSAAKS